jgi:hypothetical protein
MVKTLGSAFVSTTVVSGGPALLREQADDSAITAMSKNSQVLRRHPDSRFAGFFIQ